MEDELKIKMYSFTMDCKDPYELAKFYAQLLGWEIPFHSEEYACIGAPGTAQGDTPVLHSNKTQSMNRPYGRKGRECSSKWRIWTLP